MSLGPFMSYESFMSFIQSGIALLAVIVAYIDMRRRHKQDREFSEAQAKLIQTLREELILFRKQLNGVSLSQTELERQKLLQRRDEHQWQKVIDVARAIGWVLEHEE